MEYHHLQHFVAVAEELHFGKAAIRLNMAQPPLSQSIKRLEASLDVQLLERSRRSVSLTPAGRVLLEEAKNLIAQVELAKSLAKRAASTDINRFRIGVTPMVIYSVVPRAIAAFRRRWPGISVTVEECSSVAQRQKLLMGEIDIGVFTHYGEPFQGLSMRCIERHKFYAAVPTFWPIARKKKIALKELAVHPWIMHEPSMNPSVYAGIHAACRASGFAPNIVQHANQAYAMLSLVASGVGVALSGIRGEMGAIKGVSFLKVIDIPEELISEYMLAWVPHATSPPLSSFINLVEEYSRKTTSSVNAEYAK